MADESSITFDKSGNAIGFQGPDAVAMYANASLAMHLRLFAETGIRPTRGVGPKQMLAMAGKVTGKTYKRSECLVAAADLSKWVQEMKAALPHQVTG
jgi:hypothetical protein